MISIFSTGANAQFPAFPGPSSIEDRRAKGVSTTNYDVRMPGLVMEVIMADGKAVRPVSVDALLWDLEGWVGADYNKLFLRNDGSWLIDNGEVEEAELEVLWGNENCRYDLNRSNFKSHDKFPVRAVIFHSRIRHFFKWGVIGLA